jgi:hypothetical protein
MRDVLLIQVAPKGGESLISGVYSKKTLRYFADRLSGSTLMDSMDAIRRADLSGANPRRVAEMCLVSLCVPETGDSITALKNRISRLEAAIRNGLAVPPGAAPAPAAYAPLNPKAEPALTEEEPPLSPTEPAPPPLEEDIPWYTDDDAPPEQTDFMPPPPPIEHRPEPEPRSAPAEPASAPEPAPAPAPESAPAPSVPPVAADTPPAGASAVDDAGVWEELVRRLNGKLDLWVYPMLSSATQCVGQLRDDQLTVHLLSPLAKSLLDTPTMVSLFQEELFAITGRHIQVVFTDQPVAASPAAAADAASKLDALSRFSNFKFE